MGSDATTSTENAPRDEAKRLLGADLPEGKGSLQKGFIAGVKMCMALGVSVPSVGMPGVDKWTEAEHRRAVCDVYKAMMATAAFEVIGG